MIDSHAHVDSAKFDADRAAVLDRAWTAGVRALVNVGCDVESSRASIALAESDPRIWAVAGIHPHEAARATDRDLVQIAEMLDHDRVVAVGECGLDRGPWNDAPPQDQERLLRGHCELARQSGLPLVIHSRDAYPELFEILEDESGKGPLRGVMHCFSGGPQEARRSLDLGFDLSFSGVLTFKNAPDVRAAAEITPADRMLVETDCPYLTPAPHRGKRNEPAHVMHTAWKLAEVLGISRDEVEKLTEENTLRAFGIPREALA